MSNKNTKKIKFFLKNAVKVDFSAFCKVKIHAKLKGQKANAYCDNRPDCYRPD